MTKPTTKSARETRTLLAQRRWFHFKKIEDVRAAPVAASVAALPPPATVRSLLPARRGAFQQFGARDARIAHAALRVSLVPVCAPQPGELAPEGRTAKNAPKVTDSCIPTYTRSDFGCVLSVPENFEPRLRVQL